MKKGGKMEALGWMSLIVEILHHRMRAADLCVITRFITTKK